MLLGQNPLIDHDFANLHAGALLLDHQALLHLFPGRKLIHHGRHAEPYVAVPLPHEELNFQGVLDVARIQGANLDQDLSDLLPLGALQCFLGHQGPAQLRLRDDLRSQCDRAEKLKLL